MLQINSFKEKAVIQGTRHDLEELRMQLDEALDHEWTYTRNYFDLESQDNLQVVVRFAKE
jgi:hypothetical protein